MVALTLVAMPVFADASETKLNDRTLPRSYASDKASRLFRIEGDSRDGSTNTSWIFGTLHVGDPVVLDLFDPVIPFLDEADQVVLEVDLEKLRSADFRRHLFLPRESSLQEIIGGELFERTLSVLNRRGIDAEDLDRYRPFAAIQTLAIPRRSCLIYFSTKR